MTGTIPTPLRFFAIVQRPPASTAIVAFAVVAFGVYLGLNDPDGFDQAFGITLFLQMFAASTGYRDRLRRGHFDPILVAHPVRASIASAHWIVSIAPGLATWLALAGIELAARPHHWPMALGPAGVLAFLFVSTMVWAATLPFARLTGGALWVIGLFALGASGGLAKLNLVFREGGTTWQGGVSQAGAALVCPFLLLLRSAPAANLALLIVGAATIAIWALGLGVIARADGTLVDPR